MADDPDYIKLVEYVCNQWRGMTVGEVIQILELEDPSRQFPVALGQLATCCDVVEKIDTHFATLEANTIKSKH